MPSRTLRVAGLANARDLGGLPRAAGGATPTGVFVRSESVDSITLDGWATLHDAGVRTVVDLRQDAERSQDTGQRPAWLTTLPVDHDRLENQTFWADYWSDGRCGTALYYLPHLAAMPEQTVAVLHALATAPPGGVLFHCAAGRDRTGLVAAVLLTVAGVQPDAIVADYLESVTNGLAHERGTQEAESEAVCARFGTTTEAAFSSALAGLDVAPILAALPLAERTAIRTWRGALP